MADDSTIFELRTQKSFDFAIDVTRQLLTLSAAILALTVTVARDIETGDFTVLAGIGVPSLPPWCSGYSPCSL